jgi:hypothetical protein
MKSCQLTALLVTLLASMSVACVAPSGDDAPVETPDLEQRDPAAAQETVIAAVETPTGSTMRFLQLGKDGEHGVLVVESGAPGTMVMDRLLDEEGADLGPSDLFNALTEQGTPVPSQLRVGTREAKASVRQGWARARIPQVSSASGDFACDNDSFASTTPGGIFPNVFTRLDTNSEENPGRWFDDQVCNGGICTGGRKQYQARLNGLTQWRGKVCGHPYDRVNEPTHTVCYYPGPTCLMEKPNVWFQYNTPGSSTVNYAGGAQFTVSQTEEHAWAWYGNPGTTLDWRINIHQAMPWDQFDVLMSWP